MKVVIISGSNRAASGSRKVSDYLVHVLSEEGVDSKLFDMHELDLPMWTDAMWNKESEHSQNWQPIADDLLECNALVVVAAEWNGTVPPSLQNFIMHLSRETVGHKPCLLVAVSAGIGGTYPIAELKASINKNNRMLLIPDHVIVRGIGKILNDYELDESDERDIEAKKRLGESVRELIVYAKHMKNLREELSFDYQTFTNGM